MQNNLLLRAHLGYLATGNSMHRATLGFVDYADLTASSTEIKFCLYLLTRQSELQTSLLHSNMIEIGLLFQNPIVVSTKRRNNLQVNLLADICE